jgi:hypothetical protein
MQERSTALPATVSRTDQRQQLPRSPPEVITTVRSTPTLEATPVRVHDTPWWPDRGKDRPGGRLLYGTTHHASPRS